MKENNFNDYKDEIYPMFKNILIPISSEFYNKEIFQTGKYLAKKFNSVINLVYIIEEKTLIQTEKSLNSYRTKFDKDETKKEIIRKNINLADSIVFKDAKRVFSDEKINVNEEIINGEFSSVVKGQLNKYNFDLILMGFEKECMLNYRLFDEVDIPIWIEMGKKKNCILTVCSNLAPNKKVPDISRSLSKILNLDLHMIYVVDTQDSVSVDNNGVRSGKKTENELITRGQQFVLDMQKKGVDIHLLKGSIEKVTKKVAEDYKAGLVIIGRAQKRKNVFGIPTKGLKRKIAESCDYSILFVH